MQFSYRVRTEDCVYDPSFTQTTLDLYLRPAIEMQFSDRIRTVNCVYNPYKPKTKVVTPPLKYQGIYIQFPLMRYNFPIVYRPKAVFYDLSNCTDRKLVVSNRINLYIGHDQSRSGQWQRQDASKYLYRLCSTARVFIKELRVLLK